jgi:hypothetical protein
MATYLIDDDSDNTTAASTPAFTLGNSDSLLLTSAGQLLATGSNSTALNIDGVTNEATIQGLVYGTNNGIAVSSSSGATLYVDSDVSGENTGIHMTGSSATDHLTIQAGGIVQGGSDDGIFAGAFLDEITDYGAVSGSNYGINANNGYAVITVEATGSVSGETAGIVLSTGLSTSQLTIDGSVTSDDDTGLLIEASSATATVNGEVDGYGDGILSSGSNNSIMVDGAVQGENGDGVAISGSGTSLFVNGEVQAGQNGSGIQIIAVDPLSDETVYIGAKGEVTGAYGIYLDEADGSSVTNDGHIAGIYSGIYASTFTGLAITNDGTISAAGPSADAVTFSLFAIGGIVHNAGLITSSYEAFDIAGGATVTIENIGTIHGALLVEDTSAVDVENAGTWISSVGLDLGGSGDNTLTNSGKIHGPIAFGTGANTLTNSGTITGAVTFGGSDDTVTNDGAIHGAVTLGSGDALTDNGTIYGAVVLGTTDDVVNTGLIKGAVTMAIGDQFDTSTGSVTGILTAAKSDIFDFSGDFGHYKIADFAGGGTTRDVLSFASDDFTSYTELQSHMAQVGNDVVITLDATDDIILLHTKLTAISAHDFAFT